MVNGIDGYWMNAYTTEEAVAYITTDPFPLGTNVYANISLSGVGNIAEGIPVGQLFAASAFIASWTTYLADGTLSDGGEFGPPGTKYGPSAVFIANCASITFGLSVWWAEATAQINIFYL